ncbi:MAG: hypothetical protein MHM6MM_004691 [Cercozoa sp. M6MM]
MSGYQRIPGNEPEAPVLPSASAPMGTVQEMQPTRPESGSTNPYAQYTVAVDSTSMAPASMAPGMTPVQQQHVPQQQGQYVPLQQGQYVPQQQGQYVPQQQHPQQYIPQHQQQQYVQRPVQYQQRPVQYQQQPVYQMAPSQQQPQQHQQQQQQQPPVHQQMSQQPMYQQQQGMYSQYQQQYVPPPQQPGVPCAKCGARYPLPPGCRSFRCRKCHYFNSQDQCMIM